MAKDDMRVCTNCGAQAQTASELKAWQCTRCGRGLYASAGMVDTVAIRDALQKAYENAIGEREEREQSRRFWLIIREPGMVPYRRGPWPTSCSSKILREFIASNPTSFIDYLTIGHDGAPEVEHGPLVLQYTDGRSMSVGRRHNERTKRAALEAIAARRNDRTFVNQCRASLDGECGWSECPQIKDNEPRTTGRHCPLDVGCPRCCSADDDCRC